MGISCLEWGLILSILGTFILGLSTHLGMSIGGFSEEHRVRWQDLEENEMKFKAARWKWLSLSGWGCLLVGFVLQLISVQ